MINIEKNHDRIKNLFILFLILLFYIMLFLFNFNFKYECIFKKIFGISCPSCGMTRAFISIKNLDIIKSLEYNILTLPIVIFSVISVIVLISDIILMKNRFTNIVSYILSKYYILIIMLIILSFIINMYRGI
jgi:hypothetical protein